MKSVAMRCCLRLKETLCIVALHKKTNTKTPTSSGLFNTVILLLFVLKFFWKRYGKTYFYKKWFFRKYITKTQKRKGACPSVFR